MVYAGAGEWTGKRIRTLKQDMNEVDDRGEVVVPVGHTGVVGDRLGVNGDMPFYQVTWDDNAQGQDMGWTIWDESELQAQAEVLKVN